MWCNCRTPINCYDDKTRYKLLVFIYIVDLIFFIIRLSLVSNDISKKTPDTMQFLVPVLLFDLIASIPIIISNIIYVFLRHCVAPLTQYSSSRERIWHFATLTCIRLKCHKDRPQAILLMRLMIITVSFILKFMCFVIAAACSARFKSVGTAYTVFAAFTLVASMFGLIVEFVNFFRVWNYNPTDTRNSSGSNRIGSAEMNGVLTKFHRRLLGFIHYSLLNDEINARFNQSCCTDGINCQSATLHHHLFYHSIAVDDSNDPDFSNENLKKSFIAFYQTTVKEALEIAKHGFPYGDNTNLAHKDYLHLKKGIFFSRSCRQPFLSKEATICVSLNLGRFQSFDDDISLNIDQYFAFGDGECDTIYVRSTKRFYLRMPAQIERWIITINKGVIVNDPLEGTLYQPCL